MTSLRRRWWPSGSRVSDSGMDAKDVSEIIYKLEKMLAIDITHSKSIMNQIYVLNDIYKAFRITHNVGPDEKLLLTTLKYFLVINNQYTV